MPSSVIGISSTFLGVVGFYLSAGFYSLALIIDIICASEFSLACGFRRRSALQKFLHTSSVMILVRVKELGRSSELTRSRNDQIWRVIEALVQSTAITSAASMSLVITFVNSTSVGYPTCLNVFPPLIVRSSDTIASRSHLSELTSNCLRPWGAGTCVLANCSAHRPQPSREGCSDGFEQSWEHI